MNFTVLTLAFIEGLGGPEMLLILVLILVLFGKDKLPELARGLGKSMRELKKATSNVEEEFKRALQENEYQQNQAKYTPTLTSAQPVAALTDGSAAETTSADMIAPSPVATDAPISNATSELVVSADAGAPLGTEGSPASIVAPALVAPLVPSKPVAPHRGRADV